MNHQEMSFDLKFLMHQPEKIYSRVLIQLGLNKRNHLYNKHSHAYSLLKDTCLNTLGCCIKRTVDITMSWPEAYIILVLTSCA